MPQMFRVGDLAQQMGVSVDELIFKLRSIGVEVQNADNTLDLATVRAIITGETLQRRPREVIVRKEAGESQDTAKPPASAAALERVRRRRPSRRVVSEELPDEVPNLEAMAVPASAPTPKAKDEKPAAEDDDAVAAHAEAEDAEAEAAAEAEEVEADVEELEDAAEAEAGEGEEDEAEELDEEAETEEEPAAEDETEAEPDEDEAEEDVEPETDDEAEAEADEAEEAEIAEVEELDEETEAEEEAAAEVEAEEAGEAEPTEKKKASSKKKKKGPRTPLEAQLRELSEDEVKQRVLAAKQAEARAAQKPPRGKTSRKAKSAADADEIRDLLAKFEESKVRATTDAATPARPAAQPGRPQRAPRQRRARGEAPAQPRQVKLEFRDGNKPEGPIYLSEAVTVRELAEKLNVLVKDLLAYLLSKKILVTANQTLPQDLAESICEELEIEAMGVTFEEEIDLEQEETAELKGKAMPRPPVVTVMGHVDHGKTSLLDAVRSSRVAAGEAGGITQHIGASRIEHGDKAIVFIDTPGHAAFTQMRSRGAQITDLVVLVVAADDGVMPQTLEAINHARAAHVPLLVAINKIDKPNANIDRVKQELAGQGVQVEEWGGDVPSVEVSATKKKGIDDLLELILLVAEMQDLKAVPEGAARGTILEARKERGRGVVATVLIEQGTLSPGDYFFAGATYGRVRAMVDTARKPVKQAGPTDAVEIMGFEDIPEAGDTFQVVESDARAREVSTYRQEKAREEQYAASRKVSLEGLMDKIRADEVKALNLVIKADVQGSVEVLRETLAKLSTEEVAVNVLHGSAGAISASDVLLASASDAIVIGFNVRPDRGARELADREGVDIRTYTVIYHLTEDIQKAMSGMLEPTFREEDLGRAEVREVFKVTKVGVIAGCMVQDGIIARNAKARLLRDNVVVWEGAISSLRRFKDDVNEVKNGLECGIGLERYNDIKVGDVIEAYRTVEVERTV